MSEDLSVDATADIPDAKIPVAASSESTTVETVLIVGGAGYIGSVLCRLLLEEGFMVRVLDPLMYGDTGIADLTDHERFELYEGDARSIETVLEAIEGVDAVVHLGEIVGDPATELDPRKTLEYNLHSTQLLASICKYHQLNRFVFASSCSVYGKHENGTGRLAEDDDLNPVSLYAQMKIQSERILREFADERFSPTMLRMATVYGYSQRMRFDLVGNILPAKAHEQGTIPVFGGDQYRPNVHVEDAARAYIDCLTAPLEDVAGEVFNVGSNEQNYRIDELATIVSDVFPDASIEYREELTDERSYRVEFDKIQSTLDFEPERSVRDHCLELKAAFESDMFPDYTATRFNNHTTLESALPSRRRLRCSRNTIYPPLTAGAKRLHLKNYGLTPRDILPRLKTRASHPVLAGQVNPDGWESTVCDRRRWLCHEAVTPTALTARRCLVLCRSARSAHLFDFGSHRGKHRVNCQFSAHKRSIVRSNNQAYGAYSRPEGRVLRLFISIIRPYWYLPELQR
ncbi:SDR family oxidoreductase [Natrinema sp. SYSU A 869]|uniref:NAD-dependent epimerase/dehydratase family protein n=1 Tax=Natrinema sp. SYSU A 869 TaxID=2871694 RepID=UPI0021055BD2|nr:SDR family oxidoreductase [Natrinema sp. SYSU A 869]